MDSAISWGSQNTDPRRSSRHDNAMAKLTSALCSSPIRHTRLARWMSLGSRTPARAKGSNLLPAPTGTSSGMVTSQTLADGLDEFRLWMPGEHSLRHPHLRSWATGHPSNEEIPNRTEMTGRVIPGKARR